MMVASFPSALALVREGRVRALAVTSTQRSPLVPDLPTVAEAGAPGYAAGTWYGVFLPAKTPQPIIDRLSAALKTVLAQPALKATIAKQGAEAQWLSPAQFAEFVDSDSAKWGKLIHDLGIKID